MIRTAISMAAVCAVGLVSSSFAQASGQVFDPRTGPVTGAGDRPVTAEVKTYDYKFQMAGKGAISEHMEYLCPMVEAYAQEILKRMGAGNIQTSCADPNNPSAPVTDDTPVYMPLIHVQFDAVSLVDGTSRLPPEFPVQANWQEVALAGGGNCILARELFQKFVPNFEVRAVNGADSCGFENGIFNFSMLALIPEN